jgi:hypothetical protein
LLNVDYSERLSVLLIAILAFFLIVPFGIQVYGSTNQCDPSVNQSCPQSSQTESKTESETSQTLLIRPDLSPTKEDLDNAKADESANSESTGNDNSPASTSSTDSDDSNNADNSERLTMKIQKIAMEKILMMMMDLR